MKRAVQLILLLIGTVVFLTLGAACSSEKVGNEKLSADYEWCYNPEFTDEYDDNVKIDGVLNEEMWNNSSLSWLKHKENREYSNVVYPVDVKYTTVFTEKGVYIAAVAYDTVINYYGRFDMLNNSGFTLYVAHENAKARIPTEVIIMEADAYDIRSLNQTRFIANCVVDGDMSTANTKSITMESFISWDALNIDVSNGLPDRIKIEPVYRQVIYKNPQSIARYYIYPSFTEKEWVVKYLYFGQNGYINAEIDDLSLGNAGNGMAKTDGWNLKDAVENDSEKSISVNGVDSQAIYFKDIDAENLIVESVITPKNNLTNSSGVMQNGQFGLIVQSSFNNFRAIHLKNDYEGTGFKRGNLILSGITYYPNRSLVPTWGMYNQSISQFDPTIQDSIKMTLIKISENLLIFLNDKFVGIETLDYISGNCSCGLYAFYCEATFTDYKARALQEEEISDVLQQYGVKRADVVTTDGGEAKLDSYSVKNNEKFALSITPIDGFYVSDVEVNGESVFSEFIESSENGKFMVDVGDAVSSQIKVEFEAVEQAKRKTIAGKLVYDDNEPIELADLTVISSNSNLFYNKTIRGGSFRLIVPVAGTKIGSVNGSDIVSDGKYKVIIKPEGFPKEIIKEYVIDENYTTTNENIVVSNEDSAILFTQLGEATHANGNIKKDSLIENQYNVSQKTQTDTYLWQVAIHNEAASLNLRSYDGIVFDIDVGSVAISLDFEMRYNNGVNTRPKAFYTVSEDNIVKKYNMQEDKLPDIPSGFKGKIVILFEDFTRHNNISNGINNMTPKIWFITNTKNMDGASYNLSSIKIITNAHSLIK